MNTISPLLGHFVTAVSRPGGGERFVMLAFGTDGTMWIAPAEVGVGSQHAAQSAAGIS